MAAAPGEVCPGKVQLAADCPGEAPGTCTPPPPLRGRCPQLWAVRGAHARAGSQAASSGGGALGGAGPAGPSCPALPPPTGGLGSELPGQRGLDSESGGAMAVCSPTPVLPPPCTSRGHGYGWRAGTGHAPWACLWSHWVGTWKESFGADSVSGTAFLWNLVTQLDANSRRKKVIPNHNEPLRHRANF